MPQNSSSATRASSRDLAALRGELAMARTRIAELERLADTDPLTELANRRPFVRAIERALRHLDRHGTPAAVMFVDVDGLKAVNDRHGHLAGDTVLCHIATVLRRELRGSDLVARIGGDEFGLVLDHLTEPAARAKANALLAAVQATPVAYEGASIDIQLSIGVASAHSDDDVDALLDRADREMYAHKRAQRSDK